MNVDTRDNALSEVIGLILILAIIVMAMSVYITYTVPEIGKEGEIAHMREVRASFLELSYLIDSLWANGKTGVLVPIPITLSSSPKPTIVPLFTPISSYGSITIANESGICNITFVELVEQQFLDYSDETLSDENDTIELHGNPQSMVLNFTPTLSPHAPIDGIVATLYGKNSSEWQVDLKIRSVLTNVAIDDIYLDPHVSVSLIQNYLHSLIAVETSSQLEYIVIDNISESVFVDLKPVLDLFGVPLINGSSLSFSSSEPSSSESSLTFNALPSLIISHPSLPSSNHTVSAITNLTDLMFASSHYYWVDQQYKYHKGGVFLLQEGNSTSLADIPFHIENDPLMVSIVDIELHPKHNQMRSSGGRAQIVAEIDEIQNQFSDAMANSVVFEISSDNEDTIHMWGDIFRRMCATEEAICEIDMSEGLATLRVSASSEELFAVQYTKVDVDLEIRV